MNSPKTAIGELRADISRPCGSFDASSGVFRLFVPTGGGNTLAMYTYLEDVAYHVQAHFEWNMCGPELKEDRNENKHFLSRSA